MTSRLLVVPAFIAAALISSQAAADEDVSPGAKRLADAPLDLTHRSSSATAFSAEIRAMTQRSAKQSRLAQAIADSAKTSFIEEGTARAKNALIECQIGDYSGGGQGLLSLPFMQTAAHSDHCRRF